MTEANVARRMDLRSVKACGSPTRTAPSFYAKEEMLPRKHGVRVKNPRTFSEHSSKLLRHPARQSCLSGRFSAAALGHEIGDAQSHQQRGDGHEGDGPHAAVGD